MYRSPADLAKEWRCSERALRKKAREIGACGELGKAMVISEADVQALYEAIRCPSRSTGAEATGTIQARLPEGGYEEALERLTRPRLRESRQRKKPASGNVTWMDRHRS